MIRFTSKIVRALEQGRKEGREEGLKASPRGALRFTAHGQIGTSGERKRTRKEYSLPTRHHQTLKMAPGIRM